MLDFLIVSKRNPKRNVTEIYPKFIVGSHSDLMIRGGDFYAIWNEETKLWSTNEVVALEMIDKEIDEVAKNYIAVEGEIVKVLHLWDSDSGMIDKWHRYVQQQLNDEFVPLDSKIIFANDITQKTDYASKKLPYPLIEGPMDGYETLMSTLYYPEERKKLEWAIGAIISGDSKQLQKFEVLYGSAGTGKSTILNIIQDLFEGYCGVFDAKALGSSSNTFALEPFKTNPLVAIQHDGDLSHIEDNTRLNSVVSHEWMTVNEKYRSAYQSQFHSFLFMGTNRPVKITDAKSGILRRLIDVSPSGKTLPTAQYKAAVAKTKFELGAIAYHCLQVYQSDPGAYDNYIPISMLGASNDFYNFMLDSFDVFDEQNGTSLRQAWERYKDYCEDAKVPYPYSLKIFKEELKNYFTDFKERIITSDGLRIRNYYSGFLASKFQTVIDPSVPNDSYGWLQFKEQRSIFDQQFKECHAQYATKEGIPEKQWDKVTTKLDDINSHELHYILPQEVEPNLIVIDFDLKDSDGKKNYKRNLREANKWPKTYAELSKSGEGIHLHYIYDGDVDELDPLFDKDIEVKVFKGKSSLRRLLNKCTDDEIAHISSGLPKKEKKPVVTNAQIKSEKSLRRLVEKILRKEVLPNTKPSMDFLAMKLEEVYNSGMKYDLTDMYTNIVWFAAGSTNQSKYCLKLVDSLKLKSEDKEETVEEPIVEERNDSIDNIIFFDCEVFPNLLLVNWKWRGPDQKVVRLINPTPEEIEWLTQYKLVGFNNRRYDNHILWARMMGYNNEQIFELSNSIINKKTGFFGEAYNLSYTDVYDFCATKQSLKKWEIQLGIHHLELGFAWDQPVPEEKWDVVSRYCDNDVIATEAVFEANQADFKARLILADIAGLTPNDTTNTLTTRIIFGNDRHPQSQFVYTNLATIFPGYTFDAGKSWYRGEDPGEGGYVYAEPGMYSDVALLDVASMHPTSIENLNLFGEFYTQRYSEIKKARILIKHKDYIQASKMFDGKLARYLENDNDSDALAYALKTALNSVYGLTSASFDNLCRDPRNIDNIVAKRGALFMIDLKHAVQEKGFTVAHIKTDSIKIPNATPEIISFVMEFGKKYGYTFEHEATYEKMCLVNDAVYIAQYASVTRCNALYGQSYVQSSKDTLKDNKKHSESWTATGAQFQVPYIFKTLFSHEPLEFKDFCETKTVTTAMYLDMNEANEEEHNYIFVGKAGQFCPVIPGAGGGLLVREQVLKGVLKYNAVGGTKGYRWLEAETVKERGIEDQIDISYYENLAADAVSSIKSFGDADWFIPKN